MKKIIIAVVILCVLVLTVYASSPSERLKKLKSLFEQGLISEKDYQSKKNIILDELMDSDTGSSQERVVRGDNKEVNSSDIQCDLIVLPFVNDTGNNGGTKIIQMSISKYMKTKTPLDVCHPSELESWLNRNDLTAYDFEDQKMVQKLATAFNAKYVIYGHIEDYRAEKKFRLGGALLSLSLGGWTLYGTCSLNAKIWSAKSNKVIYRKTMTKRKKRQFGGVVQSKSAVAKYAVDDCVKSIFNPMRSRLR